MKKIILAIIVAAACAAGYHYYLTMSPPFSAGERAAYLAKPHMRLENFKFDPSTPLTNRIGPAPDFILDYLRESDKAPEYAAYNPSKEERAVLRDLITKWLPPQTAATLKPRLLGIYLVKNFRGAGFTTPLFEEGKDGTYAWMVINPDVFTRTLDQVLSEREQSAFKEGKAAVRVTCPGIAGKPFPGAAYPLAHETGHALDYITGFTPYPSLFYYAMRYNKIPDPKQYYFWTDYDTSDSGASYRTKLRFYGIEGGPLLTAAEAPAIYRDLASSPFVSLYGARNWAESAAEQYAQSLLTAMQGGRPCSVVYGKPGEEESFIPGELAWRALDPLINEQLGDARHP